jgi:hypothetical protein
VIVSGYFSHRNAAPADHPGPEGWSLPHIAEHRERLLSCSKEEGIHLEMDFARLQLQEMGEWDYDRPEVLEVKLEELAADPYDGFIRIFDHLDLLPEDEPTRGRQLAGIWACRTLNRICSRPVLRRLQRPMPLTGELLLGAVYANRFEAKTKGRKAGVEDTSSHYRKGVPGDWVNHFTPDHVEAFEERFPGLFERLGYRSFAPSARSF